MADLQIRLLKGSTSKLIQFQIDATAGGLITTLTFASVGLKAYYYREGAASATAISIVTMTVGTWSSGGFAPVDATNMPGIYQLGVPNAALASGANSVFIEIYGTTGMNPATICIELEAVDNQNGNTYGLLALPAVAPAASGGLPTVDSTNSVKIQSLIKKNTALATFSFVMLNTSGNPATGLTVTANRSIDNAAFGACANAVTEIANGFYAISLAAGDVNGDVIDFRFSASNARDTQITVITNP